MTNDELHEKIARLPTWAREHIKRLETRSELAIEEAARARQALVKAETRVTRLSEANEAMMELLRSAGKGGLDWAWETVKVLEGYEIFQSTNTGRTIAVPKPAPDDSDIDIADLPK